jgi:hypothetical protein
MGIFSELEIAISVASWTQRYLEVNMGYAYRISRHPHMTNNIATLDFLPSPYRNRAHVTVYCVPSLRSDVFVRNYDSTSAAC